jgi:hypothetical protein
MWVILQDFQEEVTPKLKSEESRIHKKKEEGAKQTGVFTAIRRANEALRKQNKRCKVAKKK